MGNLNVPLLLGVMEYIKENPQSWRQESWYKWIDFETGTPVFEPIAVEMIEENRCGTAYCFAGHAAVKAGFPKPPREQGESWGAEVDGRWMSVDEFAEKVLGLESEQADVLFYAGNSLEDLEAMVNALIEDPNISNESLSALASWNESCDDCF